MTIAALAVVALLRVQAPAARVEKVSGDAEIIRSTGTAAAREGDTVTAGDRVHTPHGSSLSLSIERGVALHLRSDTSVEVKSLNGSSVALLTEGSVNVKSIGQPARIETKYGPITGTDDLQEFDVTYSGDIVQVLLIAGGVKAEVSDPSKVVFKNAYDFGARVYEAGSISPTAPRETSGTTVIVYPSVETSGPNGRRTAPNKTRIIPPGSQVPPK